MEFFVKNKKTLKYLILVGLILLISFSVAPAVAAATGGTGALTWVVSQFYDAIMWFLGALLYIAGLLLALLMRILVLISQFNVFTKSSFVNSGWSILRNLANMFFILGMLFIAFTIVLNIQKFEWNKALGRLLVMAILVNFSRMICGLIIDFFQILMLTFVASYKDVAESTLFGSLGIGSLLTMSSSGATASTSTGEIGIVGSILGLLYLVFTIIIVGIFCIQLIIRVIALWVLITFSPLAFLANALQDISSQMKGFYNEWWSTFFNYCVVGPCLAFFLWLSLTTMANMQKDLEGKGGIPEYTKIASVELAGSFGPSGTLTQLLKFLIGVIMLVMGVSFCGRFRTIGGSMGQSVVNKAGGWATRKMETGARQAASSVYNTAADTTAAVVKAPYTKLYKPAAEALGERAYRDLGPLGRLTTERGRSEAYERGKTRLRSFVSGSPVDRRDTQQKQAQGMKKELERTGTYADPKMMERGLIGAAKDKDFTKMEAFSEMLASKGALNPSHRKIMDDAGFYKGKFGTRRSEGEQIAFGERLERMNEDNGGSRVPMSPLRYDANTQTFADRGDHRGEVRQSVANSQKQDFTKQANTIGFGNFGQVAGVNMKNPSTQEQKFAAEASDMQYNQAMGQIVGASENQFVGNMSKEARKRKVNALDFALSDDNYREEQLKLERRQKKDKDGNLMTDKNNNPVMEDEDNLTPESEQLIQDTFRYRKKNEKDVDYRANALDYYQKHGPTTRADFADKKNLSAMDKYRSSLTATYDAQGKKTAVGQGLGALDKGRLSASLLPGSEEWNSVVNEGDEKRQKEKEKLLKKKVKAGDMTRDEANREAGRDIYGGPQTPEEEEEEEEEEEGEEPEENLDEQGAPKGGKKGGKKGGGEDGGAPEGGAPAGGAPEAAPNTTLLPPEMLAQLTGAMQELTAALRERRDAEGGAQPATTAEPELEVEEEEAEPEQAEPVVAPTVPEPATPAEPEAEEPPEAEEANEEGAGVPEQEPKKAEPEQAKEANTAPIDVQATTNSVNNVVNNLTQTISNIAQTNSQPKSTEIDALMNKINSMSRMLLAQNIIDATRYAQIREELKALYGARTQGGAEFPLAKIVKLLKELENKLDENK